MHRVGFIGLGVMGLPMAHNLIKAGYRLTVFSRTSSRAASLLESGAVLAEDAKSVARASDVVISMLPDSSDVSDVALSQRGILAGCQPGTVWIDMSSISPNTARSLAAAAAEHGVRCLDAPVSGGEKGAIEGTLTIMVGGPQDLLEEYHSLLSRLGSSIHHIGPPGAGQVAKACNQVVVAGTLVAVAEAMTLAALAGADASRVRAAMLGGFAQSRVLDTHGQRMLDRNFVPGFKVRLHQKDLAIALDIARAQGGSLPACGVVAQVFNAAAARGLADADHSAVYSVIETLSSVDEA